MIYSDRNQQPAMEMLMKSNNRKKSAYKYNDAWLRGILSLRSWGEVNGSMGFILIRNTKSLKNNSL